MGDCHIGCRSLPPRGCPPSVFTSRLPAGDPTVNPVFKGKTQSGGGTASRRSRFAGLPAFRDAAAAHPYARLGGARQGLGHKPRRCHRTKARRTSRAPSEKSPRSSWRPSNSQPLPYLLRTSLKAKCSIRSVTAAPGAYRCTQDLPPSSTPRRDEVPLTLHSSSLRPLAILTPAAKHVQARSPRAAGGLPERFLREANRNNRLPPVISSKGGLSGVAGPAWLLSLEGQGVQSSLPSSCPHSSSSALPRQSGAASLERGGCPDTESFDALRYRPRSLLLQHREPVQGAVHTVEGQRIPHHIPAPRPTAVPAALTRTRASPGLRQGGGRWLCPAGGGKRAGRRRAARGGGTRPPPSPKILDRPRRGRGGGREWKPGRGGDRRGHAQEMQEPKIFHHCSRPPAPIRRGTSRAPRSAAGRERRRERQRDALRRLPRSPGARRGGGGGAPASAGAAIEMTPELGFGRSGLGPAPALRTCRSGARLRPVCGRGGAPLGVLWGGGW
ncbi:uncharacterized protein LOC120510668 [Passer montanus]|uniref:uncharacterized protein LOC120510668 n=1 Tax=Passer montanus TaxID=9160 RepID=UPI0019621639|nr:uncharacterized protein LOC120510668 [Passer montanus]